MYKHEIARFCLISHLLRSASRLLFCNDEVVKLSLALPVFSERPQLPGLVIETSGTVHGWKTRGKKKDEHFTIPHPVAVYQISLQHCVQSELALKSKTGSGSSQDQENC